MTTITPPPSTPPPPPAAVPQPAPSLIVLNPPQALTQLNIGAILEAAIAGRIGKEQLLLQTPFGQLTVQTPLALPQQGILGLQLQALTPAVQFLVTSIDGKPITQALRHTEGAATGAPHAKGASAAVSSATAATPLGPGT